MSELRVAVVPVGRMDLSEVEAALGRVCKVIHKPVELRESAAVPRGTEDSARGQHGAADLLAALRAGAARLGVHKLIGAAVAGSPVPTPSPDALVFVTDLDIFVPGSEGVYSHVDPSRRAAVVSVRRLREAFYRRKSDPKKQRSRLIKEILQAIGRAQKMGDCPDASCVLSAAQVLPDIDRKAERYCASCWRKLSSGVTRI